jgi:hypothetical protein
MTTKSAFSPADWTTVLEGPPTAGLIVISAAKGGMFRETMALAQAYTEARGEHGESELLDEIVAAKPKLDHSRFHSPDELKEHGLAQLREAASLVGNTATSTELDDYRHFVVTLASKVAAAHREHGQQVSPAEAAAIQDITTAIGATGG